MKLQIGIDGKTYEVEVEVLEDDATPRMPNYGPYPLVPATVQSAPAQSQTADESAEDDKLCRSPVAGIVTRVDVEPGQAMQADELMVVLEAMKMETNITSPVAGKVKNVRVKQGDSVKVNQVVVEFE